MEESYVFSGPILLYCGVFSINHNQTSTASSLSLHSFTLNLLLIILVVDLHIWYEFVFYT